MCSYSKPGHMNISHDAYQLLKHRYGALPRGELEVKGKGKMKTYYLLNMPVEQQEHLQVQVKEHLQVISVVDRWARKGKSSGDMTLKASLVTKSLVAKSASIAGASNAKPAANSEPPELSYRPQSHRPQSNRDPTPDTGLPASRRSKRDTSPTPDAGLPASHTSESPAPSYQPQSNRDPTLDTGLPASRRSKPDAHVDAGAVALNSSGDSGYMDLSA